MLLTERNRGENRMSEYILEMKHITKRFASVVANEDVNLSVKKARSMLFWVKTEPENQPL